jgi:hypothetical protein
LVITFQQDIPFPESNWLAYRSIYVVEQWMRRIALAALMAQHGTPVRGDLPPEVRDSVRKNTEMLPTRAYLGSDNASEALWTTTFEDLRRILTADSLFPTVKKLTGLNRTLLDEKISEITQIRNVVGHNRAITTKTLTILNAATESLSGGIDSFREVVFRHQFHMFDRDQDGEPQVHDLARHPLASHLERWLSETPLRFPPGGIRLGESELLYYLAVIPMEYRYEEVTEEEDAVGRYADLEKLLNLLKPSLDAILAVTVTRGGHTISLVWPKALEPEERHDEVIGVFVRVLDRIWDGSDYALQDERAVCHPKVWFHSAW